MIAIHKRRASAPLGSEAQLHPRAGAILLQGTEDREHRGNDIREQASLHCEHNGKNDEETERDNIDDGLG